MEEKLNLLKEILAEVSELTYASALLDWDQQCYMPPMGAEGRGQQQGTLGRLAHERFVSEEVGRLLEDLKPYAAQLDPDSFEARLLKVTNRNYQKEVKVPSRWVVDYAQTTSVAHGAWAEARQENNFEKFLPYLEKIIDLRKEYASFFAPIEHVYDALLDDFEPGMKTADVKAIFEALRPQQVELIRKISESKQVDDSFLHQKYDEQKQWDFGVQVVTAFGYDWKRGRLDKAAHPFTTNFGINDVRITTRILPEYVGSALFSTMHEAGHAMYEQGMDISLERTPLVGGASLAIHESQSRMWENLIGRSLPFWTHFYPRLQELFPAQLGGVDLKTFYKGINRVEPSLIRVEADEATYNLHIMLRLELEIAMLEGTVAAKDLPELWNTRFQEYLGITPTRDAEGVLQDIHWSAGLVGYFSTYALGNLISAQLWEKMNQDNPGIPEQIQRGDFSQILGWLREKIHCHGSKYEPQELIQRVTGSKIDPAPYMKYLNNKYKEIYGF
jgi:carboxypeptidase Taq